MHSHAIDTRRRIGFDSQTCATNRTGTGIYSRNLLQRLEENNSFAKVIRVCPTIRRIRSNSTAAKLANACLDILYMQCWYPFTAMRLKLDLVHYPANIVPIFGSHKKVVTIHDMSFVAFPDSYDVWFRRYFTFLVRVSARRADHIITDSEASKSDIVRLCSVHANKVSVISLGVDPTWSHHRAIDRTGRQDEETSTPDRYVLAVGEFAPRKNLGRLIEAFDQMVRRLPDINYQLVLIGPAYRRLYKEHLRQLKNQARSVNLEHRIHFIHDVAQSTLIEFMRKADALAFVSLHEGFGLPILEAMVSGVPVLCSNTSSIPEVAAGAALYVNPLDSTEISNGLERILFDQSLRRVLVQLGAERASQLSWQETARKTVVVYEQILLKKVDTMRRDN
jgi:glycosyltransferase involved in cell wall biosynthesis